MIDTGLSSFFCFFPFNSEERQNKDPLGSMLLGIGRSDKNVELETEEDSGTWTWVPACE